MVTVLITGLPKSGSGRMEVIKEDFKTEVCSNIPKYPLKVEKAAGSMWKDGKLTICGGYRSLSDDYRSECYSLENGEWILNSDQLKTARESHAASNIGNRIFITGGWNGQTYSLASTEIVHPDGKITQGPKLPQDRWRHCQISYEQNTFIIGKSMFCCKKHVYSKGPSIKDVSSEGEGGGYEKLKIQETTKA